MGLPTDHDVLLLDIIERKKEKKSHIPVSHLFFFLFFFFLRSVYPWMLIFVMVRAAAVSASTRNA